MAKTQRGSLMKGDELIFKDELFGVKCGNWLAEK
jgi:hypothetical protein